MVSHNLGFDLDLAPLNNVKFDFEERLTMPVEFLKIDRKLLCLVTISNKPEITSQLVSF